MPNDHAELLAAIASTRSDPRFSSRTHRLGPPKGPFDRVVRAVHDWLERRVAGASVLPDAPVYDSARFPWAREVEKATPRIRAELAPLLEQRRNIPSFQDIVAEVGTITSDDQWKTFFLVAPGMDCSENHARCPETVRALEQIPDLQTAFFSILEPGKHLPAHRGAFNGLLRYHLGLFIPDAPDRVGIRIGTDIYRWSVGESLIFDDTFNHEAWNFSDEVRVVLFVDFVRPMRPPWRGALKGLLALAALMPFARRAAARLKNWERHGAKE